jgi:hypothetical protein
MMFQQRDRRQQAGLDDGQDKLVGRVDPWVVIHRDTIPQGNKDQPSLDIPVRVETLMLMCLPATSRHHPSFAVVW